MASSTRTSTPDHVFVAPSPGRVVVKLVLAASLVLGAWSVVRLFSDPTTPRVVGAVVAGVVLVACWAYLQAHIPQRITVTRAVIEVRRDGHTHRYDLEDPAVDIRVRDGEIAFAHYMDNWVLVSARDVEWKTFSDVVMHYQNNADNNAVARDQRFNR